MVAAAMFYNAGWLGPVAASSLAILGNIAGYADNVLAPLSQDMLSSNQTFNGHEPFAFDCPSSIWLHGASTS